MRTLSVCAALGVGVFGVVLVPTASADSMDPDLSALSVSPCDGFVSGSRCSDDEAWQRLMAQLSVSLIPDVVAGAQTDGPRSFKVSLDTSLTSIDSSSAYWNLAVGSDAASVLTWTHLAFSKGLPFGFEFGASIGHLWSTRLWAWGAQVRWVPFEGFFSDVGAVPDIGFRGAVRSTVGDSGYMMTALAVDVTLSKPIPVGGEVILTPFLAPQFGYAFVDSEVIDLDPSTSAVEVCDPTPGKLPVECPSSSIEGLVQFGNNLVFPSLRSTRWRMAFGLGLEVHHWFVNSSFAIDLVPPGEAKSQLIKTADSPTDLDRQWTMAFSSGVHF